LSHKVKKYIVVGGRSGHYRDSRRMPYSDPQKRKEYRKRSYEANIEHHRAKNKEWRMANRQRIRAYQCANKERIAEYNRNYRQTNMDKRKQYYEVHKEHILKTAKKYRDVNRELVNARKRTRRVEDPNFRWRENIRNSLRMALKKKCMKKIQSTHEYLGCTLQWLVTERWPSMIRVWNDMYPEHKMDPEALFSDSGCIEIDHIKPLKAFEMNEIRQCNHYTNLQPLPKAVNGVKKDTWQSEDEIYWRFRILFNDQYMEPYIPVGVDINQL